MVRSKARKLKRKKYKSFRAKEGITHCEKCGKQLTDECHHIYCNFCWRIVRKQKDLNRYLDKEDRVKI